MRLCGLRPSYRPQDAICFDVVINTLIADVNAVEASVIWITQGKGTEDMGVHFFQRLSGPQLNETVQENRLHFQAQLPEGPLSYRGQILRINWVIRVRLFLSNGEESHVDRPFLLEPAVAEKA